MTTAASFAPPPGGVLVASASSAVRAQLLRSFDQYGGLVQEASGGADALAKLESGVWQVLFLDQQLPDLDAAELARTIHGRFPGIEVVMLNADNCLASDVSKISGWENWLGRTVSNRELASHAATAEDTPLQTVSAPLTEARVNPLPGMVGDSPVMQRLYKLTRLVASHATTVLITGCTGTGKELVARAVHQLSRRASQPFVVVNCAAIPETLLESELFGYVRGAFTGAVQTYAGRIYAAHGGTLFLDEVGELPLGMQAKLLRFLDRKEVQRLGSQEILRVDARVVAATNAQLDRMVEQGRFRADLFYRLSAFPLELPRLAERPSDIVPLAQRFLTSTISSPGAVPLKLSEEAIRILEAQPWEGNVRELQQVIERASILAEGEGWIRAEHLYFGASTPARSTYVAVPKSATGRL